MIIDGKKIAQKIYDKLKNEIGDLKNKKPKLGVIFVGEDFASLKYINQKRKWAEYIGMDFELKKFSVDVLEKEFLDFIKKWNNDDSITGYIVQLPLPKHLNSEKILNAISPLKDVDGFHPINQGKILIGDKSGLAPCTPAGVMYIFDELNINLSGKEVVVIGRSNIVGKPIVAMMINAGATVTSCNSKTIDITKYTKKADIVILATGVPGLLKFEDINDKTIVIDVGFSIVDGKIYGDASFEEIEKNGNLITPVPGGVGRLTVAMLLKNTYKVFKQKK